MLEAESLDATRTIPGGSWAKVRAEAGGNRTDLANARDRLLKAGQLVNTDDP